MNHNPEHPQSVQPPLSGPIQDGLAAVSHCQVCGAAAGNPVYRFRQRLPWASETTEQVVRGCGNCGFLFLSPRPDRAALAAHYLADTHGSGQVFRDESGGSRAGQNAKMRADFIAGLLAPGTEVLDIGCGQGLLLEELRSRGMIVAGLEPSPAAAASAAARGLEVVQAGLGGPPASGDPAASGKSAAGPFAGRRFDTVVMVSVLEHLWDPADGVTGALDLLKPDGLLVIEVPNALQPTPSLTDWFSFEHLSHFSPATLARLLRHQGFRWASLGSSFREGGIRLGAVRDRDFPTRPGRWEALEEIEARCPVPSLEFSRYPARQAALIGDVTTRVNGLFERWHREGRRIAIYGAGLHSLQLAELVPLRAAAECFIDGDPRKHGTMFCGLPVEPPDSLRDRDIGAVLLSTGSFIEEMAARVRGIAGGRVAVADCYGQA